MGDPGRKAKREEVDERLDEATNDETLEELSKKERIGNKAEPVTDDIPSPDAESGREREKQDDAGPM